MSEQNGNQQQEPMRIHAGSDFREMDDELLVDLTDAEVQRLIDLECGRQGIQLLPPHPGPEPTKPEIEDDVRTYEVSLGYSKVIEVLDMEAAQKVAEALSGVNEVNVGYRAGSKHVFEGTRSREVKVAPQMRLSQERYEAHKDALKAFDKAHDRWEELDKEYRTARDAQSDVAGEVRGAIEEAWQRQRRWDEASRLWDRYLELADGQEAMAARFLKNADVTAWELLVQQNVVQESYDVDVEAPVEEAAPEEEVEA